MRHGKKFNHLGRTSPHRKAMLSNMASSLILNKRISTTVAKAKELRKYVEPLLTRAKDDSTHSRRTVFSYLQNKDSVNILFTEVAEKIATRPGGYTRILKTGNRLGDKADMCIIELVDYNEIYGNEAGKSDAKAKTSTRRGRRGAGTSSAATTAPVEAQSTEAKAKAPKKPKAEGTDQAKTTEVDQPKTDDTASAADSEPTK
ncbi:MAG TPA: 50S ribosomal protein L17 [Cytophagaceae bacterium]|jgi:large subunit ribosomal protein L17